MLTQTDCKQIQEKGINVEQVHQQIEFFRKGIPFLNIVNPAIVGDGIVVLDQTKIKELTSEFENQKPSNTFVKFVPASGAATRMFKSLFEQLSKPNKADLDIDIAQVLSSLQLFAFYPDLIEKIKHNSDSLSKL